MRFKGLKKARKLYFIGIGGISMSALAKFLVINGYEVSGSDEVRGETTQPLSGYGIRTYVHDERAKESLQEADAIVYTDAIPQDHAEFLLAKQLKKTV